MSTDPKLASLRMRAAEALPGMRRLMAVLGILAVCSLILHHGFPAGVRYSVWFNWFDVLLALGFCTGVAAELIAAKKHREALHSLRFELLIIGGLIAAAIIPWFLPESTVELLLPAVHQRTLADLTFGLVRVFLLANVFIQLLRLIQGIFAAGIRLELVLAGSFGALTLLGTLLLMMPRVATDPKKPITFMDALFTATSAVCVTGLGVRDTGADFSPLGQMIILALIQVGGLGIVTFVAFISVFSAKTLPVPQMVAFRQSINAPEMGDLKQQIAGILLLTAFIEGAGAASLYAFAPEGMDAFTRLKWSVFHSVSAFCNAGFALQTTGLEPFRANPGVNITIMSLITLGSLGFLVLPEVLSNFSTLVRNLPRLLNSRTRRFEPPRWKRFTVQTRMSLHVTFWLILIGTLGILLLETGHLLEGMSAGEALLVSTFQSVTLRTAGFNTIPFGELHQSTLLFMIIFMVIGGCPVSTAGGIKTVTFGVLLLSLQSMIFRRQNVEAYGRTIPPRIFFTALNVTVIYAATAAACMFFLSVFDPGIPLRDTMFETISALSTVGLSTGITGKLTDASKVVLCIAMFIGRVGPIALVFSVFQARGRVEYEFPSEDVVVG